MKVIIHDLQEKSWQELGMKFNEKDVIIGGSTDGAGSSISDAIGACCQLVIISRCVYGGFSPFIQGVLERCREYFAPLLELRNGLTHYKIKKETNNTFGLVCCFYGDNIMPGEQESARIQSVSDGISLRAVGVKVVFYDTIEKLKQLNHIVV